ncbi:hypothetical protein G7939_17800 [Ralstonia solanacearum]|uniref:hypothetical protein n=1 Tax=Ralstonia pseudosolanacearum TaxID=1310165 RepID=UPI00125EC778|nr:hypothetical protein [Ralstonia pseudosolanacearum]MCK4118209.1 hypothetical protein [Ralstonia pseudosolanacearum]QIK25117.1 hypothetical protein G7939_17800 [Ralstonia solanacearum]QIK26847.1 hypothetical protein G7947_00020 [Ralstonia solanacearum]QIK31752.1 hypothetical protein G7969_00020 [Ralstonia solanacearum]
MSEREQIARMATELSDKVFKQFYWSKVGPENVPWECAKTEHDKTVHPTDVVFCYDDPYREVVVYLNFDLKSYSKSSITPGAVRDALVSLGMAVDCAPICEEWTKKFCRPEEDADIRGVLFVYNHDGQYQRSTKELLEHVFDEPVKIPKGVEVHVIGPTDVQYLYDVAAQISRYRGDGLLPDAPNCSFFHPDVSHPVRDRARIARKEWGLPITIEMVLAPWQMLKYRNSGGDGLKIFYRGEGATSQEFLYLLDYMVLYQILSRFDEIEILMSSDANENFSAYFEQAIQSYKKYTLTSLEEKKAKIKLSVMDRTTPRYFTTQLGMGERSYD